MGFAKEIRITLESRFLKMGFTKKGGILWKSNSEEAAIFLGLGYSTGGRPAYASFFPVLGVRFDALYGLQATLGASPASRTNPNLSTPLIYLTTERHEYEFFEGTDNEPAAQLLISDVLTYGVPYYERFATVRSAVEDFERSAPDYVNGLQEFLPVANYNLGNHAKALEQASRFAESRDSIRGTGKVYHAFLKNLQGAVEGQMRLP